MGVRVYSFVRKLYKFWKYYLKMHTLIARGLLKIAFSYYVHLPVIFNYRTRNCLINRKKKQNTTWLVRTVSSTYRYIRWRGTFRIIWYIQSTLHFREVEIVTVHIHRTNNICVDLMLHMVNTLPIKCTFRLNRSFLHYIFIRCYSL